MRARLATRVRRATRNPLARNVALLTGATALGQAAMVLSSPVIARLYEPSDLGILAVFVSLLAPLIVISSLSYQLAVPLPEDEATGADLLVLSVIAGFGTSLVTGVVVAMSGPRVAEILNSPELAPYLWLLPLSLFGAAMYQAISAWAVRAQDYRVIARTRLTQSLATVIVQLGLGALSLRPGGLLIGDAVGRTAGSGVIALRSLKALKQALRGTGRARLTQVARRYSRFPLVSTWSVLFNSASQSAPAILMAVYYGPRTAGWLALSQRVIAIPMRTIGQSVAQVYVGNAAALARTDLPRLRTLFLGTIKQLFLIGLVPFAGVAVLGPVVFRLVFGSRWTPAGEYSQMLAPMFLVQFMSVPVSQTLNVLMQLGRQLTWDLLRLLLVVGVFVVSGLTNASSATAVAGYAGALTVAYCIQIAMSYQALSRAPRTDHDQEDADAMTRPSETAREPRRG